MGMYDEVLADCPQCGTTVIFQSKAGYCSLQEYTIEDVPPAIAGDIIGMETMCPSCLATIKVLGHVTVWPVISKL